MVREVALPDREEQFIRKNIRGIAPYRPGKRASELRQEAGLEVMIKLSSNESPLPPFPRAIQAIRAVADKVNRYPDSYSTLLRRRIGDHLGVPPEQVVLGNGSNELIALIAQVVVRPGDEIVSAWPSFVVYPIVAQTMEAVHVAVPNTLDWRHDLAAMAEATTERTRLVFVCNPNNPTGTIVRRAELDAFMSALPDSCLVVFDEAYREYVTDEDFGDGMSHFDGDRPVAVLRTFSKMYGLAGLRVGYGALPTWLAQAVEKVREPFNVNVAAQVAAFYSLGDEDEVARRRRVNHNGRERIYEACRSLGVRYEPSEANFVCIEVPDGQATFDRLVKRGVIVRALGPSGMLRVTVGTLQEVETFVEALAAVTSERERVQPGETSDG